MSKTPDGKAIDKLFEVSVDGAEHSVAHYLYFPTQAAAAPAVRELRRSGFAIEERVGAYGNDWLVLATHKIVPSEETMLAIRERLEALADAAGGEYDGWEAEAVSRH